MPTHDPATFDIETSTYVIGSRSIAIVGAAVYKPIFGKGEVPSFKPITLTKNLVLLDSFEDCNTYDDITASGWTVSDDNIMYTFSEPVDLSAFNCVSLWAKSAETSTVRIQVDLQDNVYNYSDKFRGEILDTTWKRYDFEVALVTRSCDLTNVTAVRFGIEGDYMASLWFDEIYLLDLRTVSNRSSWIPINTGDVKGTVAAPFSDAGSPGLYGGINYIGKPDNQKLEIKFQTNATYQDDEVSFIDTAKKNGRELYLRAGRDGFSGYITSIQNEMKDTYKGLQRCGTMYLTQEM